MEIRMELNKRYGHGFQIRLVHQAGALRLLETVQRAA